MNMPIADKDLKTWNTYQFINSSEIISNHLYIRINRTNTYYDVFYNYTNLQFTFFSIELNFLVKINAKPGEYFNLIFPCDTCILIVQQQSKSLQILTCLDNQYQSTKELDYQPNFNQLTEDVLQNTNFSISLWIKEFNLEDGLNELQFYQLNDQQFNMNFRIQKFKYIQGEQKAFDFKQKIYLNWYYFQYQSRQIKDQVQENQVLIKSKFIEKFQYQIKNIKFFFQNNVVLFSKNIIYAKFIIQFNSHQLIADLCQPDCMVCENQKCKICKNNLQLQDNICKCPKPDQFTDQNGICIYQLNLLNLEEQTLIDYKCQFGYYLNYGECVQCPYKEGVLDINCLNNQNSQKLHLANFQQNFKASLQQIQQIYQKVKCPQQCTSCVLQYKIIICNQCSQGTYLQYNLCQSCQIQNCEICKNNVICILCQDEYSLDENNLCEYTQEDKFQQYSNYLLKSFQSDLRNCQFNLGQICYICKQGNKLTNGVCQQYQSFNQIYDQSSIYGIINYGYVHSIQQDLYYSDILDLYKIYFETSLRNQIIISQYTDDLPAYSSINLTTYSFCKKYQNCFNFIAFNFHLIQTKEDKFQLAYQNNNYTQQSERFFDNLDNAFFIANLQESLKFILINISSHNIIVPVQDLEKILYLSKHNYNGDYHLQLNGFYIQAKYQAQVITIDSFKLIKFNKCIIKAWPSLIILIKSSQFEINDILLDGNVGFDLQASNITMQRIMLQNLKLNFLFAFVINQNAVVQVFNLKIIECQLIYSAIFILNSTQIRFFIQNTTIRELYMNRSQLFYSEFIKQINYNLFIFNLSIVNLYALQSQIVFLPPQFFINMIERKQLDLRDVFISDCILTQNLGFIITSQDAKFINMKNITLNNIQIDSMSLLISINKVTQFDMQKTLFTNIVLNNCSSGLMFVQAQYHIAMNETKFQSFQGSSSLASLIKFQSKIVLIHKFYFENTNYLQLYRIININSNVSKVQQYEINHLSRGRGQFQLEHDLYVTTTQSFIIDKISYTNIDFVGSQLIRLEFTQFHGVTQISTVKARNLTMQTKNEFDEKQSFIQIVKVAVVNISYVDLDIQIKQRSSNAICYIFEQLGEFYSIVKYSQFNIRNYGVNSFNQIFQLSGNSITIFGINIYYDSQSTQKATLIQLNAKIISIQSLFFKIKDQNCLVLRLLNKKQANQIIIQNIHLKQSIFNNFLEILESSYNMINISQILVKGNIQEQFILINTNKSNSQIHINGIQFTQLGVQSINFLKVMGDPIILFLKNLRFKKTQQSQYSNSSVIQLSGKKIYIQRVLFSNLKQNVLMINANYTNIFDVIIFRLQNKQDSIDIDSPLLLVRELILTDSNQIDSSLLRVNTIQFRFLGLLMHNNNVSNGQLINLGLKQAINFRDNNYNNSIIDGLISYSNICTQQCYLLQSQGQNIFIKIKNSFYISDQAWVLNKIFGINIIYINIINIKTQLTNDYTFIDSDSTIKIISSYIAISFGLVTKNNHNLSLDRSFYKFEYDKQFNDSDQIPDKLQLQINQQDKQIRLLEQANYASIHFNIDNEYYGIQQYIYFPSGQPLNNYKILDFKSKQFKEYINFIKINGIDDKNIKISLTKCYLNASNNDIKLIPNYINSQILLSDIVFIVNPYVIQQFLLSVQCIYNNITLQLNINARMFKCQIGEILYQDQCQQCNISNNQFSVNKRSQVCKYIDHNLIDDYKIGLLKLKIGYWRPYYSNDQIEQCKIRENCLGGWNVDYESCQTGYLGPLCNECDVQNIRGDGHFSKYKQKCFTCEYNINVFYMIVILIVQLITLIITTRAQYLNNQRYQQLIYTNKYYKILNKLAIDQISVVFKQIQNYFFYIQFIDLAFEVDLNLGFFVNFSANPIQLLNPSLDCFSQYYNYSIIIQLMIQIVTPLFIIILFYIMVLIINKFYKFKQLFVFIYVPLLYFFIIYQIIIFQNSISQITFVTISGIKWINAYRSLQFYEQSNIQLFIFSSLILLIFTIIIPSALLFILKKKRTQLYNKTLLMKLGYLYQEYKNQIYYWEFYKMAFKIIFITISYQLINQKEQSLLILSIYIFIIATFNRNLQPFNLRILNNFDTKLHTQFLVTLICIYMLVSQLFIKQVVIIFIYISNLIQLFDILKFFIIKFLQTNPILVDTIIKTLKINFKSQVQKKQITYQQFQKMKKFIISKGSQRSVESVYTNRPYSIQISSMQSVQTEKNQEIELMRIK